MVVQTSEKTPPRLWVRRFAIVTSLEPFKTLENRDITLRRGLNIIWGTAVGENESDALFLSGHSVGKTLFCRLLRYGLGESTYAEDAFQQQVEHALENAYVGLEVIINGDTWSVLRPLCKSKSIGKGTPREERSDYAAPVDHLEEVYQSGRFTGHSFDDYLRVLDGLAKSCLPKGLDIHERPFDWNGLLQLCARDQEARFVELTALRSTRSHTGIPLDHAHSDLLVRSALNLANAEEAKLSIELRNKIDRLESLKKQNAKNRDAMWTVVRQLWESRTGTRLTSLKQATETQQLFSPGAFVDAERKTLEPELDAARQNFKDAQKAFDQAYYAWLPVGKDYASIAEKLSTRETTDEELSIDAQLKELEELKAFLKDHGHHVCDHCELPYKFACQHRLDQEEVLKAGSKEARTKLQEARAQLLTALRNQRDELQFEHNRLKHDLDEAEAKLKESRTKYYALDAQRRHLDVQVQDITAYIEGVRAADEGKAASAPLPIQDTSELQNEIADIEEKLSAWREDSDKSFNLVRDEFNLVVQQVLDRSFSGNVLRNSGRIQPQLRRGRRQDGEAVNSLAVILFDLCMLRLTATGQSNLPGLLIHDSPREADLQRDVYHSVFDFVHNNLGLPSQIEAPFQYIITTTTPPPTELQSDEHVVLRLSGGDIKGLLLQREIGDSVSEVNAD